MDNEEIARRIIALETRILELERLAAPRTLTVEQRAALVNTLKAAGPHAGVELGCPVGDPEAFQFLGQISSAFRDAGWDVMGSELGGRDGLGLSMHHEMGVNPPAPVTSIVNDALRAAGLHVGFSPGMDVRAGTILVFVGRKPQESIGMSRPRRPGEFPR
jgi:hypothetical protein